MIWGSARSLAPTKNKKLLNKPKPENIYDKLELQVKTINRSKYNMYQLSIGLINMVHNNFAVL
ncbi:hypothetical protein SAMN05660649_05125 [Desulfotomaculum arcticum]|uniref:Uncharacterized protein n=1 Tax=Desulfotruncus arcticus DSM 17038 TaxID=1121424 RepID=A0A1I2ZVR1_9FIRM|nr:hypothetical protein SAMN05660649_05125 [Desulfotomaculum arcticum] [Desulfotruncus arcticus DSM 17038]